MVKNRRFYEVVAQLFYAVAMADKQMTREEKLKIIDFTKRHWTTTIEDSNTQEFIYANLRKFTKDKMTSKCAYNNFKAYYLENNVVFDDSIKSQLLEACNAIADSFGKKNKSELILLGNLSLLFKD